MVKKAARTIPVLLHEINLIHHISKITLVVFSNYQINDDKHSYVSLHFA